jgi:Pycsar effector protein
MKNSTTEEKSKMKLELLLAILNIEGRSRDALANKSSILIASNAILMTALIGFGVPTATGHIPRELFWFRTILTVVLLSSIITSTLFATNVLAPFNTYKQRRKIMDLPKSETNLIWFGEIAELTKAEYFAQLDSLSASQAFEQLAIEAHNSARLLTRRYTSLNLSHHTFAANIVLFAILTITKFYT